MPNSQSTMNILGIDPGTRRAGFGLISKTGNELRLLDAGIFDVGKCTDNEALLLIKKQIDSLIKKYSPKVFSIEKLFFSKNQKTAMSVAESRGVSILAAMENHLSILEFSPNEVKSAIAGFGLADKKAVLKMVRLILKEPKLEVIDDASDALALAIVAAQNLRLLK
jgi:crossover junction endodeoxyribonuclease RuvC